MVNNDDETIYQNKKINENDTKINSNDDNTTNSNDTTHSNDTVEIVNINDDFNKIKSKFIRKINYYKIKNNDINNINYSDIISYLKIINSSTNDNSESKYIRRFVEELELLNKKQLIPYLLNAVEILDLANENNIPHVTRGSCGSSYICYLLGISHVDPIKYNISFARFLNDFRDKLPDVDFDFPYNLRDDIFMKIELKWVGKVARISNHIYYHEKSALREALRSIGIRKMIPKYEIEDFVNKLPTADKRQVKKVQKGLIDTFKCYSLHCGGIIFYPSGIPEDVILEEKKNNLLTQVKLDKRDVSKNANSKIDILSSRGLSQLYEIYQETLDTKLINFEEEISDSSITKMLSNGNNIGLTLGESPLMRKTMMKLKPANMEEVAICLSIIRPAAKDVRFALDNKKVIYDELSMIYDDDAIRLIAKLLKCDEAEADSYRRKIAKEEKDIFKTIKSEMNKKHIKFTSTNKKILETLKNLNKYSFCKAHAFSYGQLVWKLAYAKLYYPKLFWKATLNHTHTSYKKWVHYVAAINEGGINFQDINIKKNDISIYAENRKKTLHNLSINEQLAKFGYWNIKPNQFYPNCYLLKLTSNDNTSNDNTSNDNTSNDNTSNDNTSNDNTSNDNTSNDNNSNDNTYKLRGIIASSRVLGYKPFKLMLFIGYDINKFIELTLTGLDINKKRFNHEIVGISVNNMKLVDKDINSYEVIKNNFEYW